MKRHILFGSILFLFALVSPVVLPATPLMLKFEVIDNTGGLPSNAIRRIHQDKEGYMWFASPNGLIKYDGYEFKMFRNYINNPDLLSSNIIRSLADSNDLLWIGTESGLNSYNKQTREFQIVNLGEKYNSSVINKIVVVNEDCIWIACNAGILRYNPRNGKWKEYTSSNDKKTPIYGVQDIYLDSKGRIWSALWNKGLMRYDKTTDSFIQYPRINETNSAITIYEDNNGCLWIGSWGYGLFKLVENEDIDKVSYKQYFADGSSDSLGSNYIYSMVQDKKYGYMWIGHRNGLSILKDFDDTTAAFDNYKKTNENEDVFDLSDLNSIYIDNSGLIWLGLLNAGVRKINLDIIPLGYNSLEQIHKVTSSSYITSMLQVAPDCLWLGIKNSGIYIYDSAKNNYVPISDCLREPRLSSDAYILDIANVKRYNEIWVTVRNKGVFRIKVNNEGYPVDYSFLQDSLPYNRKALKIHEDKKKNIWVLSSVGLSVFTTANEWLRCDKFIDGTDMTCIAQCCAEDREGNMWIGSRNSGLFKFILDNNKFYITAFTVENGGINNRNITAVMVDSQRRIWVATQGGGLNLFIREKNCFQQMNTCYNIPYDMIYNLFEDGNKNIWLNNENALIKLDTDKNVVQILNVTDKMWNNMFTPFCPIIKTSDSEYLIGGAMGYNILDTSVSLMPDLHRIPVITDILQSGKSVFKTHRIQSLDGDNYLVFSHKENDLYFTFSSLVYDNPGKHRYAYRLLGYEEGWHHTLPGQHIASYINIPKGEYEFQLRMTMTNDLFSDKYVSQKIKVEPSSFDTWYAWCIYIILFMSVIYFSYRVVNTRIQLKRQVQQAKNQKRNAEELAQTKLRFFTNISHDLLTPLTVLGCTVEDMKRRGTTPLHFETMQNNLSYLTRLIRQILEFRKMENDKLNLKIRYGNISEVISHICEISVRPLMAKKHLELIVTLPDVDIMGWFDSDKLDKIIYNLLSNAYKYNKENGLIKVDVCEVDTEKGRALSMSIADTGIGIEKEQLPYIFNRFYDGEYRKQNESGTGIGLSLVKSLVTLCKGTICVSSTIGIGSTFYVVLPIEAKAFDLLNHLEMEGEKTVGEDKDESVSTETVPSGKIYGQGCTLLLVEDNSELLNAISELLSEYYNVLKAENGKQALSVLQKNSVDLVVSDVMMPEMDGFELCTAIKNNIEISHIPVILLTAKVMEEDRMHGYDVGANGYVVKPFAPSLLLTRISSIFRNKDAIVTHFRQQESLAFEATGYSSIDEDFIDKINKLAMENIDDPEFDYSQFSDKMGMSKSTLYRKIKEMTSFTPIEFVKNIRLKYSRQLLKNKMANISDVAYAVGFTDPKYFSKCFKKEYGMTPNEYVKSLSETTTSL